MKKYLTKALAALLVVVFNSCFMDFQPTTSYSEDTFWYGAENARGGLAGCYSALLEEGLYGGISLAMEECVAPNAYHYANSRGWNNLAMGIHTSETDIFARRWKSSYTGIGRCNLLLDKIDLNQELSAVEVEQMKAQARFLRAFYYSILANYYYKVPLITDSPNISQQYLPRTEREEIISFIIQELDEAANILPLRYSSGSDTGKATRGAALALKARILLFEASPLLNPDNDASKWREAADAAKKVMDLGVYSLYTSGYRSLFSESSENSSECIFDVQCIELSGYGHSFDIVMRQWNTCAPLKGFVDSYVMLDGKPYAESAYNGSADYENRDPRFTATVVYPGSTFMGETVVPDGTNSGYTIVQTGFTFKKYTVYDSGRPASNHVNLNQNTSPINLMLLRYADILLMYAEAMNEAGELTEEIWNRTVRAVRERAGFTRTEALQYPGTDQGILRSVIHYERLAEFAGEGMYYNDLRRWKKAEEVMDNLTIRKYDGTAINIRYFNKDRDYWWPVPSTQMEANPNLAPNNPGW